MNAEWNIWEPCSRERFFEVCAEFGVNRVFASDLLWFRPAEHQHDTESEVRGNLALIVKMDPSWPERMNAAALAIQRHEFRPMELSNKRLAGQLCDVCIEPQLCAAHNTEPLTFRELLPAPRAQLHEGTKN